MILQIVCVTAVLVLVTGTILTPSGGAATFNGENQNFKVTKVSLKPEQSFLRTQCPQVMNFRGEITTNGPGTVKYVFVGQNMDSSVFQLQFDRAGTKSVSTNLRIISSRKRYLQIKIIEPNDMVSDRETGSFEVICTDGQNGAPAAEPQRVEIFCPVKQISAQISTPLPKPWWQTPQLKSLHSLKVINSGDEQALVCEYRGYETIDSIMRRFPEGKSSCQARTDRFVCW